MLRATTACNFSSLIWPAGSAPAALASLLFDPSEPQIIGKTQCFATFLPFHASASSFFLYSFSSTLLSNLSLLSASSLLCFSSVHIVGSLTSKLPSIIYVLFLIYIYIHMCVHICKHIHLHTHVAWPRIYVSFCLCTYFPIYLSISLSNDLTSYETSCVTY